MKHKGRFSIDMPLDSSSRDRYVHIEISDEKSRVQFLRVKITPKAWTLATVGSLSDGECEFDLYRAEDVGKRHELKEELVTVPRGDYAGSEKRAAEAVEEYNVDGWVGRVRDAQNHHRRIIDGDSDVYKVTFTRLVDDE